MEDWIVTYDIPVTTVRATPADGQDWLARRATAYIIELATMKVVWKHEGDIFGVGDSAAKQAIDEIKANYL